MTAADFAPLSLHAGIEAADMNGDGAVDLVVVADGAMPAGVYAGTVSPDGLPNHALGPAQYLYGSGGSVLGPAELSPNVIVGSSKGDPDGVRSPGGDLGCF